MVHSTWGNWFVRNEIEAHDPDGLSIWYLGCDGFCLRTPEATVYIDPYFGDGDPPNLMAKTKITSLPSIHGILRRESMSISADHYE